MQVHVQHVGANVGRTGQAHLRVHVGTVHVHLAAVGVDQFADFLDRFLEHAVGGRVGNHQRAQVGRMLLGLGLHVGHVHVAVFVGFHHHHLHAQHLRGSRVGTVRRLRNQADGAVRVATAGVVAADSQQAGVLALRAGVRLHGDGVKAGNSQQLLLQAGYHFQVAGGLLARGERVHVGEFWPGHRNHLAGGIQLHGAAAQADHAVVHGQVAVFQLLQVAQHFVLAVVLVEHRVAEDGGLALQAGRDRVGSGRVQRGDVGSLAGEDFNQLGQVGFGSGFVEGHTQYAVASVTHVDAGSQRSSVNVGRMGAQLYLYGVVELFECQLAARRFHRMGENGRQAMDALGNALHAGRAVVHGVHAGHIGQQHLAGADVGVGFFAADVLLAGLQRHAQRGLAFGIDGHANDAARRRALHVVAEGKVGSVRAAKAHRHAKALGVTQGHVGAHFCWRLQRHQCHHVGCHDGYTTFGFDCRNVRGQIQHVAGFAGVLEQRAKVVAMTGFFRVTQYQLETEVLGTGFQYVQCLRQHAAIHKETVAFYLGSTACQRHAFGGGGGFVQQRGVGDVQTGEVDHHLLVVQQRFQAALGDFGLVRGVGGVPARVFQHVTQDHAGGNHRVVTHADKRFVDHVLAGYGFQVGQGVYFALRGRQVQRAVKADTGRHGLCHQVFQRAGADFGQHLLLFCFARADVAGDEFLMIEELRERHVCDSVLFD